MSIKIIAEAGVNHNGDLGLALKLVEEAKKAGADYVKFQRFRAEDVATLNAEKAAYQKLNTGIVESQKNILFIKKYINVFISYVALKNWCYLFKKFTKLGLPFLIKIIY